MSSLADEINKLQTVVNQCRSCYWYAQQDKDTQKAFDAYVEKQDPENPYYRPLYDVCVQHGLDVVSKSFRDHLRNHHAKGAA